MHISSNLFIYINIFIALIYLTFAIIAFKKGMIFQILSLIWTIISLFGAWFLAPIFAGKLPIIKLDEKYSILGIEPIVNTIIYCVIFSLLIKLIFVFISPLLKKVSDIPLIGWINKLGGFIVGLINATVIVLLLSLLLDTPLFSNGKEIKENTGFKYCKNLSSEILNLTLEHLNSESFKDIENFDIDDARNNFSLWLVEQGVLDE